MTTALSERVAARARERIEARGLKKKALATALDISQSQAYSRISGRVAFDVDQLPDLAEFLGCRIEDLLLPVREGYKLTITSTSPSAIPPADG